MKDTSIGFNIYHQINPPTNKWQQIAFVKNNITGIFYLQNSINGQNNAVLNATYSNNDFCIGKDYRDNVNYFKGKIGLYLIYDYSMTNEDITQIYDTYKSRFYV